MNIEAFYLEPEAGHVVEIYTLHRYHYFLTGYCRSIIQTPKHLHLVGGFKRESTVDLTQCWAVPYEWESLPLEEASIGLTLEQPWMLRSQPRERNTR